MTTLGRPRPAYRRRLRGEQGAAAVEFALVMTLLIMLVFGIVEFGRAYNTKIELSGAAREGARRMAVSGDASCTGSGAKATAIKASPTLGLSCSAVTVTPATCSPGTDVEVKVTTEWTYVIPPFFSGTKTLTGVGVMRCGG